MFAAHAQEGTDAALPAYEIPLNPSGAAFEVNRAAQGHLWISDYIAGEIWELDLTGGIATVYQGMHFPADARRAGDGSVWYAEIAGNQLGQLSPVSGTITLWDAPGANALYATQVDPAGNVWVTDYVAGLLFRFDPEVRQMCRYDIPSSAPGLHPVANGQGVWLVDVNGESIYRLDPATNVYSVWILPTGGYPIGLDLDLAGNLWWADNDLGTVQRLEAGIDRLTTFTIPVSSSPSMIDVATGEVWFTDDTNSTVGRLRPAMAAGDPFALPQSTVLVTPTCSLVEPVSTVPLTVTTHAISFTRTSYPVVADGAGWQIYQVPDGGAPYGIRASGKSTWLADYERQTLTWTFTGTVVSACKYVDADGDLNTDDDRTPLPGWRVYLKVDGVRQEPGDLTSAVGCYAWLDLDAGHDYGVVEELPQGWTALTPSEHVFGPAVAGEMYRHTFVNAEQSEYAIFLPVVLR
jgi:streptogramin lyase